MSKPHDFKRVINKDLMAALNYFAAHHFDPKNPYVYTLIKADGTREHWSVERVCKMANSILSDEELNLVRFETLKEGLKYHGCNTLYQRIMGEPLK